MSQGPKCSISHRISTSCECSESVCDKDVIWHLHITPCLCLSGHTWMMTISSFIVVSHRPIMGHSHISWPYFLIILLITIATVKSACWLLMSWCQLGTRTSATIMLMLVSQYIGVAQCNDIIDHDLTWNAQRTLSQEIKICTCYHMATPYMYDLGHEFIPGQVVDDHISSHKKPKICTRNINEPIEIITVWWGHDTLGLIAPGNKKSKRLLWPILLRKLTQV